MKRKILIIIIILFCLAIIAGAIFVYSRNNSSFSDLTRFMPAETVFYIEYNLKDKNLEKFYENNFRGKSRFERLLSESGLLGDMSQNLIKEVDKMALMVIKYEESYEKVWLLNSTNIHRFHALLPPGYFESMLDSKTTALATNRDVLRTIREIDPRVEYTGQQRKVLNKFLSENFINIYLANNYLEKLSLKPEAVFYLILNNLDLNSAEAIFCGLQAEENKIVYKLESSVNEARKEKYFSEEDKNILEKLPLYDLFLNFISSDLENVSHTLKQELFDSQEREVLAEKYEFDWQEVEDLLAFPGVVFIQNKTKQIETSDIFNLKKHTYGVIISTDWNQQEMINKMARIKTVIKNILAFKYPSYKTKKLPDGSSTTEIVADASIFNFKLEENVEFINFSDFNFSLGYTAGNLVLGNDKELVKNILNQENQVTELDCPLFSGQELAIINSDKLIAGILSFVDLTLINLETNQKEINLKGCLIW